MQRGFARPLFLISALLVIGLPVALIASGTSVNSSLSKDVKGTATVVENTAKPGFSVTVTSNNGTWELVKYLCKDLDECSASLTSGKRVGSIGGGSTSGYKVNVESSPDWSNYTYVKYFVKSGWGSATRTFSVKELGSYEGSVKEVFEEGEAVVSPVEKILNGYQFSATFTD